MTQDMLFDEFDREVFSAGQEIFRCGDLGDCAYLVEEGAVEVIIEKNGEEQQIKLMGKNELFGEIALIDYQPRTATVRAVERTTLVPIPRQLMEAMLAQSDPVLRHLLLIILERFRNRNAGSAATMPAVTIPPEQAVRRQVLQGEATQKLALAHGMKRALMREEFELFYQPICSLETERIAGFEALIRWHHPKDGLIPPKDFLWVAEQTDLIHEVGLWTLERACRDWPALRRLTNFEKPFITVNLSVAQLNNVHLISDVRAIIANQGILPDELKLELTETIMVAHPEQALKTMEGLIQLGCKLALDDYGAGYSGLTNLQRYPISTLKIDRAFVDPILESMQSLEIVRSTVVLAHSLGMSVVAEGVEKAEVSAMLKSMKCDFGQGWHYGRPAPLQELVTRYSKT
ncbi:MAG: EAL domain-containing protein [Gallionella sp.]|nr:EAL domain-containing protein [Gallionella sp.]